MMARHAWNLEDLRAELRRFEGELRARGLREQTVNTYVGRAETFLRWLGGTYESRGPNAHGELRSSSPGRELLIGLRDRISREDLATALRDYAAITGYDRSLTSLRTTTDGNVDLTLAAHRDALLAWLRSWGCRHLRRADNERTAAAVADWWREQGGNLPRPGVHLTSLGTEDLDRAAQAYLFLAQMPAAGRRVGNRETDVAFGATAAAKTLFALRPDAFPPWDEPIRASFNWNASLGQPYRQFLELSADALVGLAGRLGVEVAGLPDLLGRPTSTAAKIVDEYLWIRVTRAL
jgi:hypothetical protein